MLYICAARISFRLIFFGYFTLSREIINDLTSVYKMLSASETSINPFCLFSLNIKVKGNCWLSPGVNNCLASNEALTYLDQNVQRDSFGAELAQMFYFSHDSIGNGHDPAQDFKSIFNNINIRVVQV